MYQDCSWDDDTNEVPGRVNLDQHGDFYQWTRELDRCVRRIFDRLRLIDG